MTPPGDDPDPGRGEARVEVGAQRGDVEHGVRAVERVRGAATTRPRAVAAGGGRPSGSSSSQAP